MTYSVTNWLELYENHETRKRKSLGWVLVPNRHDSLGFCQIMDRPDGLEVFGVWNLVLQCASKCETRGRLVSGTGVPYTAADLAIKTRADEAKIENALEVLTQVGWLTAESGGETTIDHARPAHAGKAARHADIAADDADIAAREEPGTEGRDAASAARGGPESTPVASMPEKRHDVPTSRQTVPEVAAASKEVSKEVSNPPPPPRGGGERAGGFDIPPQLHTERFVETWAAWLDHLAERGRPLTAAAAAAQLADLASGGAASAVERLQISLQRNYRSPASLKDGSQEPARAGDAVAAVMADLGRAKRKAGR